MRLWRPVGIEELEQIYESGLTAFPPRLPEQPIFYPVLNLDYAIEIARDWNVPRPPFAGYVTEFEVDDAFAGRYERQIVGRRSHVVFLNFAFWEGSAGAPPEPDRPDVVESIRATWRSLFPKLPLPACGTG